MKHIRRSVSLLMVIFMLAGLACVSFGKVESTSSLSPKKVVAILYDDSGSMFQNGNKNWFYANYAFQIFTGLLNPGDDVLLTFMSEPGKVYRSDSDGILKDFSTNRQKTLDEIRKHPKAGDTPFDAIDKLGSALHSAKDEDPTTQYWFVIIADGGFERVAGDESTEITVQNQKGNEVDDKLAKYAGEHDGKEYNMIFMAIEDKSKKKTKDGKDKQRVIPKETDYIKVRECDGKKIVDVMSEMADTITGRYRVDESKVSVSGKEIKVSSAVPLLNIQVLSQNSDAKVSSAKASEGSGLKASSVSMSTPKSKDSRHKEGKALYGTLGTIVPDGDYISAGDYTITMDKEISGKDIVVMYEAALETRITITRNGKVIEDTSTLRENEKIDITAELVILGTDEVIDINALPDGLLENMTLTVDENGTQTESEAIKKGENKVELKDYTVSKGETVITARTDLTGFAPLITKETFTSKDPVVYGIKADGNELVMRRGRINGKNGSVDFTVTGDGQPLSKADVESLIDAGSITITHDQKQTGVKFLYDVSEDGKLHVYPKTSFLNNAFAYIRVPLGEYQVTASVDEKTSDTGTFTVKDYPIIGYIITFIILALILLMLYLLKKPHFPGGTMYRTQYSIDSKGNFRYDGTAREDIGFWTKFFTLSGPRRITSNGLELEATQNNKLHVTAKWIAAHQSPKTGRDHFTTFPKPDPKASTKVKAAMVKNAYIQLRNTRPEPKSSPDKNKLFDTNSAFLAIIQPQIVNTYQFIKSRNNNRSNNKNSKRKGKK